MAGGWTRFLKVNNALLCLDMNNSYFVSVLQEGFEIILETTIKEEQEGAEDTALRGAVVHDDNTGYVVVHMCSLGYIGEGVQKPIA